MIEIVDLDNFVKPLGFKDFTGFTVGYLTVERFLGWRVQPSGQKKSVWLCNCKCGNSLPLTGSNFQSGSTRSCGCYHKERIAETKSTHGMTSTTTYKSWSHMLYRCNNPSSQPEYGGEFLPRRKF